MRRARNPDRNNGLIIRHAVGTDRSERTFIVSGLARSGTSMVARALHTAGVFLGSTLDDIVFEDLEIAEAIESGDRDRLKRLIARRDRLQPVWGFKRPHLHQWADLELLKLFRNPRLVLTYRDPVAIATRNRISEHIDELSGLRSALDEMRLMTELFSDMAYPMLMVSYEKAVGARAHFIQMLLEFTGLTVDHATRLAMVNSVEAERDAYLEAARRKFEGYVDSCDRGRIVGWCRQVGSATPLTVDVFVERRLVATSAANVHRADLAAAGYGNGDHGFEVAIDVPSSTSPPKVEVFVHGRMFKLRDNSAAH